MTVNNVPDVVSCMWSEGNVDSTLQGFVSGCGWGR